MWIVGGGLLLNLVASIGMFSWLLHHRPPEYAASFFAAFLVVWAFIVIGFILLVARKAKLGATLISIGSLLFVPVGLVAIVGSICVARRQAPQTPRKHRN